MRTKSREILNYWNEVWYVIIEWVINEYFIFKITNDIGNTISQVFWGFASSNWLKI